VYFKELTIVGSNAFAMEEFEGVRKHAIEHYLSLVQDGRIDLTSMVTHRYPLENWWDALKALSRPAESGVVKATFAPNGGATSGSG
jgi:threonine dehydrogenase-like Zn-dependent dehydrogenase